MTIIKVGCPYCGEQQVPPSGVLLTTSNVGWSRYSFMCPECKQEIVKDANVQIVGLLARAPVQRKHVQAPLEFIEDDHTGPPLTYDDLLDFVLQLGDDWLPPEVNVEDSQDRKMWHGPV